MKKLVILIFIFNFFIYCENEEYSPKIDISGKWEVRYHISQAVLYNKGKVIILPETGKTGVINFSLTQSKASVTATSLDSIIKISIKCKLTKGDKIEIEQNSASINIRAHGDFTETEMNGYWEAFLLSSLPAYDDFLGNNFQRVAQYKGDWDAKKILEI